MKKVNKILTSTLVLSTMVAPAAFASSDSDPTSASFTDMDTASPWAQDAINNVKKLGLMTGSDGAFRPKDSITRQEVAAILVNVLKLDTPDVKTSSFTDVTSADWGMKHIEAVKKAGLMVGNQGEFRPNDRITREELATILVHAANGTAAKGDGLKVADQAEISDWAKGYVQAAMEMGLMSGDGTNFKPKNHAQRQEVAAVLLNFVKVMASKDAVDTFAPALSAINHAADAASMKSALEVNAAALGIDVSDKSGYGNLKLDRKPTVALDVYQNRPADGYKSVDDVKVLFNRVVQTRTVIETSLDSVNSAISVDEIAAMNRKFITDVIADLQDAQKTPGFTVESGNKISDTISALQTLVANYDALTEADKKAANGAIQGKSFTSYNAMIQAFTQAVNQSTVLNAINASTDAKTMKSALEANASALGIDVSATSDYGQLQGAPQDSTGATTGTDTQTTVDEQLRVALDVYANKPASGYTSLADVKALFNQAVKTIQVQGKVLDEVNAAKTADELAAMDKSYLTQVIAALEDAALTANYTIQGGNKISDTLVQLKNDVKSYNELTADNQKTVNQALVGKSFITYSDLVKAFEEALQKATSAQTATVSTQSGGTQTVTTTTN